MVCVITHAATCPLTWVVAALQNCNANKTLTSSTRSRTHIARILTLISHADTTLTALVQWCATARVQPLFHWHGCCERSEGKHLPHSTALERQQSGRCRRHCSCRSFEGNGFDDPHNLGFAQATQLSTTHHLRDLSLTGNRCEEAKTHSTCVDRWWHSLFQTGARPIESGACEFAGWRWAEEAWSPHCGVRQLQWCPTDANPCRFVSDPELFVEGCHVHHGGWSKEALAHRINDESMHERREFKKLRMSDSLKKCKREPNLHWVRTRTADDHHAILLVLELIESWTTQLQCG